MIIIALGGNLPSREGAHRETLRRALPFLEAAGLKIIARSSIWLTEPVPRSNDPWYANQVIAVATSLSPDAVLAALHKVEARFERERSVRDAPRTLDLDLIAYDDAIIDTEHLIVPHPRMHLRAFVLAPLLEIAPEFRHPISGDTVQTMLAHSDRTGICRLRDVPMIMGVVNVTPDSFSDATPLIQNDLAIAHALELMNQGADILDIGGESTRPGASPVSPAEEQRRIMPVLEAITAIAAARGRLVSVDTRHASTMAAAVKAGATMINDVSALGDPMSAGLLAEAKVPVVLMHMQGDPQTMQVNPAYGDVVSEVAQFLDAACTRAIAAGIAPQQLWVDPGIGFGKTLAHNIALLNATHRFGANGRKTLIGASRKGFIARIDRDGAASERLGGSIAAALAAAARGATAIRVHDVEQTRQALAVWSAVEAV
jgi:dihydropteroate synthase/2-amino-4-hydroxy-6-hydroxymethyldihydropteridine diphosphokinase